MKTKSFSFSTFLTWFLPFLLFANISILSQVTGDYRSATSGNWNTLATWERYNGISWLTPTSAEGVPTDASGVITIRPGHTVTIANGNRTVDQLTIDFGGQLIVGSLATLIIANGNSTDLAVNGLVQNLNTINLNAGSTIIFNSGSVYDHFRNGGTVPAATWNTNSTCKITGVTNSYPAGLSQSLGNLYWNCPNQTNTSTPASPYNIGGNLEIENTGTGQVRMGANGVNNVLGNYAQKGGNVRIASNTARTLNIGGNFSIAGGTLQMSSGSAIGTMNVAGNFSVIGGLITETGNGSGLIVFNRSGIQTYTSGGNISNTINFVVNSNSTLQMVSGTTIVQGGGSFTLSPAASLGITSSDGISSAEATGNIQVTGLRNFNTAANYIYNGNTAQLIGSGFPNNLTGVLTINNIFNTVTLNTFRTIANGGSINLTAGNFNISTLLSMASTSSITRNDGSMSGTLQGAGLYNVTFEHNSKTTGPELSGSGLNNVTVKLNSGESLTLDQSRNARGTLTMTTGDILLNGNNFALGVSGQAGVLSYNSGLMQGPGTFTRWFTTNPILLGTEAGLFPMGFGADNRSVWLAGIPAVAGSLSITHSNADGTTPISFIENSQTFDKRTNMSWSITPANGFSATSPTLALRIQGSGIPGINSVSDLNICISTGAAGGVYSAPGGTITNPQVNRSGMTSNDITNTFYFASTSASPLPVELSSFSASIFESKVKLNWRTETEVNNYGFEILRSFQNDGDWKKIGFVPGNGNSNSPKEYSFTDEEEISGKYFYRLKQIDNDGKFAFSKTIEIEVNIPKEYKLIQNYPNPFNPVTQISYSLPKAEYVVLKVYNILGSEVAVLENSMKEPGNYSISFNGSNLASGIYLYTLEAGNFKATKKMILTK